MANWDGQMVNGRWCEVCQHYHGGLYNCEHYPEEVRREIEVKSQQWIENLTDENWIQEQLNRGIPLEVIAIQRWFAGVGNNA